jgi:hypothetical protein
VIKMAKQKGFGALSKAEREVISSKGGRAAHKKGTAHEWDSEEGKSAGQKGGSQRNTDYDVTDEDLY